MVAKVKGPSQAQPVRQSGALACSCHAWPACRLPAGGSKGEALPGQAAELAGRFRCVLVDLQGQGASPEGSARGNMLEHHATDCLAVVSALQLRGAQPACLLVNLAWGSLQPAVQQPGGMVLTASPLRAKARWI